MQTHYTTHRAELYCRCAESKQLDNLMPHTEIKIFDGIKKLS